MKTRYARAIRIGILARRVPYTEWVDPSGGEGVTLNLAQWGSDGEAFRSLRGRDRELAWRAYWRTSQFTAIVRRIGAED